MIFEPTIIARNNKQNATKMKYNIGNKSLLLLVDSVTSEFSLAIGSPSSFVVVVVVVVVGELKIMSLRSRRMLVAGNGSVKRNNSFFLGNLP